MDRRRFLQSAAAVGISGSFGCASMGEAPSKGRVVVIGGGYGGATAAKYVRLFSGGTIDVTMIEPNAAFISCPISNLVIGGTKSLADLTTSYDALGSKHGVKRVRDTAVGIDAVAKTVKLASGGTLVYDKLVVSPGIDLVYDRVEGLQAASASGQIVQAWRAGPETAALRAQLEAMPDGGVYAITIPEAPYRCPPGPYERACQVASYFKRAKPRSKVLILDANQDVTSKGPLFKRVWSEQYKDIVEYRPQHNAVRVDAGAKTVKFEVQQDVKADVLNVLPMMRAGSIAVQSGLANANGRWCNVDYQTFESTAAKDVHVIGDSIQVAPLMPKSGHMANAHAKVAAAAVVARLLDVDVNPAPMLTNTCYSFVDDKNVIHVASVHRYDADKKTFLTVPGSGGVSPGPTELEGHYALSWARNIWADTLG